MQSISFVFLIFMSLLLVGYYIVPVGYRYLFLFACNILYYLSWIEEPLGIVPIFLVAFVTWFGAETLGKTESQKKRKGILFLVCFSCIGLLAYFKYFTFLLESIGGLFGMTAVRAAGASLDIVAPLGISFFTFQGLSYVIEVYRKRTKVEHDFVLYAAFLTFFPIVLSGPIERPDGLLAQLRDIGKIKFSFEKFQSGILLILWGGGYKIYCRGKAFCDRKYGVSRL